MEKIFTFDELNEGKKEGKEKPKVNKTEPKYDLDKFKDLLKQKKKNDDEISKRLEKTQYKSYFNAEEFETNKAFIEICAGLDREINKYIKDNQIPQDIVLKSKLETGVLTKEQVEKMKKNK